MEKVKIVDFFEKIEDNRRTYGNKQHELIDIIAISICAVISGADTWEEIADYGKGKQKWLKTFLNLPNSIPAHDTFNRVISSINPDQFESCFRKWISSIIEPTGGVISIDGKTIRGAKVNGKSPIHMVSAWSSKNLVLGQVKVNEKSNEITAIPELLTKLAIEGSVIRIESVRDLKNKELIEKSTRYYISSLDKTAEEMLDIVRSHWGVENKLHWMLDVAFNEDYNRKRAKHAAQNFSLINKIALSLLKQDDTKKFGVKSKRKSASWDENYLLTILGF